MGIRNGDLEVVDALVVGSGFGAAVAAQRLAEAGKQVVVMERGRRYGPGDFARTPAQMGRAFWDPSEKLYGLFDAWSFRGLEGLVSSGLGGGSLIYANVLLRKDEHWFVHDSPLPGGGYEHWPVSRADLDPHYDVVERALGATPYPYDDTPKTRAVEQAAVALGMPTVRPPLAVTFARPGEDPAPGMDLPEAAFGTVHPGTRRRTCSLCGECDIGCNTGAKNTLDHTYLAAAAHHGADLRTLHEVRAVRPLDGGGYLVRYVVHPEGARGDVDTRTRSLPEREIVARRVVLGAGTFGTTFLLLRSRASLPDLGPALGTRFSGNGDLLTLLLDCTRDGQHLPVDGGTGPVITTAIRRPDALDGDGASGRGYYVEDAGFPGFLGWLVETAQLRSTARRAAAFAWQVARNRVLARGRSNVSADLSALLGDGRLSAGSLPLLGMGRDVPDGRMSLHGGRLAVDWTTATSRAYFDDMRATMQRVGEELGARFQDNPLWWMKRVVTVHPLGGAPMGRHAGEGVCDAFGEVHGHPGLHVVDGAALPGPVGANPSLTIAALADRAATRMLEQDWARPTTTRFAAPVRARAAAVPGATSVAFTERMTGPFTLGVTDPARGALVARSLRDHLTFVLTITAADIDAFVADPLHRAQATGFVESNVLGGRLDVEQGWFQLFVHPTGTPGRRMLYRLWLRDTAGSPLTLLGSKQVEDDRGLDVWADTTTLHVRVVRGHLPPPTATTHAQALTVLDDLGATDDDVPDGTIGAGVLVIRPLDLARQLTTFRTHGDDGAAALARFGRLFLGELWDVYVAERRAARVPAGARP
ncbi:GMC oxidoreductase [Cellulomonas fimi]|uniref:Cholesterol oxidase n=1 Tax=Cellulomonas fimi (strain ATCC 484 / DSM 20113 / JCM 1341 / CCUG 24087 / LMG 16345 / NBRC 15513 / NCIMB 8980 / NCTC 7547 / NRS-133) TaxID=590998 RepID=F4H4V4_CELFA|nr:GMC oxidoreductase [Cellulomonas fimi]AEE45434.1 fumarate reductase/succinate dehydrogenase flavoprotein domain protein [Cellulomonas fimi ATCC 484]NNH06814.1 GMC family oxidoreductase [Cellulomonas fimi]VEH29378.1 Cholesterol oxidase [Cellulomonas fimi]